MCLRILSWIALFTIATPATSFAAAPGTVEEFSLPEAATIVALGPLATGSDGSVWFGIQRSPHPDRLYSEDEPWLGRMSPSGLMTLQIPSGSTSAELRGWEHAPLVSGITEAPDESIWFTAHGTWAGDEGFVRSISQAGTSKYWYSFIPSSGSDRPGPITHDKRGDIWLAEEAGDLDYHLFSPLVSSVVEIPIGNQGNEPVRYPIGSTSYITSITEGPGESIWFTGGVGNGWETPGNEQIEADVVGKVTQNGAVSLYHLPADEYPGDIVEGADHNMWFTLTQALNPGLPYRQYIERLTGTETLVSFPASPIGPLVLGPDGNLWFVNQARELERMNPSGEVKNFVVPNILQGDLAASSDGSLWFVSSKHATLGKFAIPFTPVNVSRPAISGEPVEGHVLYASPGEWAHEPDALTYQWQICDVNGINCANLGGETGAAHGVGSTEIGHTLKVAVTATNRAGAMAADSATSSPIVATPSIEPKIVTQITPAVGSTALWKFAPHKRYTTVSLLSMSDLPPTGTMELSCAGRGCVFHRRIWTTMASPSRCRRAKCLPRKSPDIYEKQNVSTLFRDRHLAPGARVTVAITKPGWIGRTFVFKIRSGKAPSLVITCSAPNSKVSEECGGR